MRQLRTRVPRAELRFVVQILATLIYQIWLHLAAPVREVRSEIGQTFDQILQPPEAGFDKELPSCIPLTAPGIFRSPHPLLDSYSSPQVFFGPAPHINQLISWPTCARIS